MLETKLPTSTGCTATAPRAPKPGSVRGSVLIVVLVITTAVSLLALGAMSDSNLQLAMVRNDQFYLNAHRVALSEINAQIDSVNSNPKDQPDTLILNLLDYNAGELWTLDPADFLGPNAAEGAFTQLVSISPACDPDDCLPPSGYTLDDSTRVFRGSIQSNASLGDSGARSNQTQSFWYLLPQGAGTW